jgi:hemerythrin-like domain-containing protein
MSTASSRSARPRSARATRQRAAARPRRRVAGPLASFRHDHASVLARLASLEVGVQRRGRLQETSLRALIAHLERQFATHMAAEEAVIFPALEQAFPESAASLGPLFQEHAELREMLAAMARILLCPASDARDDQLVVQGRDFADLLRLHIHKEEAIVFDVSERVLGARELRGLARRLAPFVPANAPRPRRRTSRRRIS